MLEGFSMELSLKLFLIHPVLVRESFQNVETFNENITAVYNASSPPTSGIELSTQPTETKCDYIDTEIAADTNSSVTIRCESNDRDFTVYERINYLQN